MSGPNAPPQQGQQNFRTPVSFLRAVQKRFGCLEGFAWDLAAEAHNCVGTEGGYMFPAVDALLEDWNLIAECFPDRENWCNPPFNQAKAFCAKAAQSRAQVKLLCQTAAGSAWWARYVDGHADIINLRPRIRFDQPDGTPMPAGINRDCVLLSYPCATPGVSVTTCEDWREWLKKG